MRKSICLLIVFFMALMVTSCNETFPTLDFSYALSKSNPMEVDFKSSIASTDEYGEVTYEWDFGDGSLIDSTSTPTHEFKEVGDYNVKLKVKSSKKFVDGAEKVKVIPIKVAVKNFDMVFTSNPTNPLEITFEARGEFDNGVLSYEWDFGNGRTANGKNVTVIYGAATTYKVTLTAKVQDTNFKESMTKDIDLKLDIKTLDFTYNPDKFDPLNVELTAVSTASLTVNPASIEYTWNFGFNNIKKGRVIVNKFANVGSFNIKLTANVIDTDIKREVNKTINTSLYIDNADFTYGSIGDPLVVTFNGTGSSPTGEIEYEWDFGNGIKLRTQNTQFIFRNYGDFVVTLRVSIPGTNVSQLVTKTLKIEPPVINDLDFQYTQDKADSLRFLLEAKGTAPYGTLSYIWSYGFGQKATGKSTVIKLDGYGTHFISLNSSIDNVPIESSVGKLITVSPPILNDVRFEYSYYPANPLQIYFNGSALPSDGSEIEYEWDFGFGQRAKGKDYLHLFDRPGDIVVNMKATIKDTKISKTVSQKVYVNSGTKLDFQCFVKNDDINDIQYLCQVNQSLIKHSKNPKFTWDFGDKESYNNYAEGLEVIHQYPRLSVYTVTLTLEDANIGTLTKTKKINVLTTPVINYWVDESKPDSFGCRNRIMMLAKTWTNIDNKYVDVQVVLDSTGRFYYDLKNPVWDVFNMYAIKCVGGIVDIKINFTTKNNEDGVDTTNVHGIRAWNK